MAVTQNRFWACNQRYRSSLAAKLALHAPQLDADVDKLVGHLSGGERQMLNLVIAIHLEHEQNPCRLILLDEHTARLDHDNALAVMEFTSAQVKRAEATTIMVTHRYPDAIAYGDRIVVMGAGQIKHTFENRQHDFKLSQLVKAVEDAS
jgi:putative tryptophan/tyrosine transport system ATP-binding protein